MSQWTLAGHLGNGEAVYRQRGGLLAVEKEYRYLVEPTPEERAEIYKTMSHLRPSEEASDGKFREIETEEAEEARL